MSQQKIAILDIDDMGELVDAWGSVQEAQDLADVEVSDELTPVECIGRRLAAYLEQGWRLIGVAAQDGLTRHYLTRDAQAAAVEVEQVHGLG